ncbi:piggyBac transposable element-derived protein 4-like [Aphis craccivora]|uniref:PiggyBac transposable element-derived protein 4-like n=1 Tax=Aphis craccivora TaxID=307492 RepID=A0A6G0ZEZ5_APHCR|nr:piggyBac transposable element-derived protein 4-like [Aphis craccivora]
MCQHSTEDENENHSISVHSNVQPLHPAWNTVSGDNQKHFNFIGNSEPLVILDEGEIFGLENNSGVVVSKFKEIRDIYLLSTRHLLRISNAAKKTRNHEDIIKPDIIKFYNADKARIDFSNQASYYTPMRKIKLWFHKVATEIILNTFIVNAQIILEMHKLEETKDKCRRNRKIRRRRINSIWYI